MMQQKVKTTRAPGLRLDKNRRLTPMQICKRRVQRIELSVGHTSTHILNTMEKVHTGIGDIIKEELMQQRTTAGQQGKQQHRLTRSCGGRKKLLAFCAVFS